MFSRRTVRRRAPCNAPAAFPRNTNVALDDGPRDTWRCVGIPTAKTMVYLRHRVVLDVTAEGPGLTATRVARISWTKIWPASTRGWHGSWRRGEFRWPPFALNFRTLRSCCTVRSAKPREIRAPSQVVAAAPRRYRRVQYVYDVRGYIIISPRAPHRGLSTGFCRLHTRSMYRVFCSVI